MKKEPESIRTSLRLQKSLYDKLAEAAEARGLTMHAEIITRLEASFAPPAPMGSLFGLRDPNQPLPRLKNGNELDIDQVVVDIKMLLDLALKVRDEQKK